MGSSWSRRETGGDEEQDSAGFGAAPAEAGLKAEEWNLLRTAPDYDAEEMSTVWPGEIGTPLAAAAAPAWSAVPAPERPAAREMTPAPGPAAPPTPVWAPPTRVEQPAPPLVTDGGKKVTSGAANAPAAPIPPAELVLTGPERQPFPEERTLALMAEDLLGRPLDGPAVPAADAGRPAACGGGDVRMRAADTGAGGSETVGADLWDQVMPLWAEGAAPEAPGAGPAATGETGGAAGRPPERGSGACTDVLDEALTAGERVGLQMVVD